jgi:hypothetical protein
MPGGNPTAGVIRYALNHREGLLRFLDGGRIELDSNTVWCAIRPVVLGRRNALFASVDDGGRRWADLASLVETCKLNAVDPQRYLTARLVDGWPNIDCVHGSAWRPGWARSLGGRRPIILQESPACPSRPMLPSGGRGSPTVWLTDTAIAAWEAEPRTTRGGQPRYSALAISTSATLRAVFRLALRQTEGLIGSIIPLLGLDLAVPDHTTLSRRAGTLEVPQALPGTHPIYLLVDSTGLQLCGPGEWLVEKHGSRTRRSWHKLHIGVDADTASQVGPLLDQVAGPTASFAADAAYDQDGVYREVAARHPEAAVIVPPRSSAVPSGAAETARSRRDEHLRAIAERGRMGWQKASG